MESKGGIAKFQEMSKDWENNPKILRKIIENLSEKIDELQAKATAYDRLVSKTIMSDAELDAPLAQKILREMCEKAEAYDRLIEKLSLWGKHLKSASMAQNSLDFVYCAQQVMDEITLTLPDGWEER